MSVAYCCGLLYMAKWFSTAEGEGREGSRSVCLTLLPLSHMWMGWRVIRGTSTSSIPNSLRDLGEGRGLRNKGPESPSYPAFTLLLLLVFTLLVDGLTKIHKSCMPHRLDVLGGGVLHCCKSRKSGGGLEREWNLEVGGYYIGVGSCGCGVRRLKLDLRSLSD